MAEGPTNQTAGAPAGNASVVDLWGGVDTKTPPRSPQPPGSESTVGRSVPTAHERSLRALMDAIRLQGDPVTRLLLGERRAAPLPDSGVVAYCNVVATKAGQAFEFLDHQAGGAPLRRLMTRGAIDSAKCVVELLDADGVMTRLNPSEAEKIWHGSVLDGPPSLYLYDPVTDYTYRYSATASFV